MSMGYIACEADTISWESIEILCPETAPKMRKVDFDDLARYIIDGPTEDDQTANSELLSALYEEFSENTGLELELCHHGEGDIYDDIEPGHYWRVDGVYELSEAGKKYQHLIDTVGFVEFG